MIKLLFIACCFFCLGKAKAQTITAAEYFFDSDPGSGLGSPISVGTPGTAVNFTANISSASLSAGFHTLAIRVKDAGNVWSLFETRAVYVSGAVANAGSVIAAEYFIDADPGAGNASAIAIGSSGNTVNFLLLIPAASLTSGFHTLAIRTKNANGIWGLFESRAFYITSSSMDEPPIVAAEFFVDTDPGAGNGVPIGIGGAGNAANFTVSIPTNSLPTGFHTLAIRTRNAASVWGLFEVRPFYISSTTSNAAGIVAAEFFIDNDPGLGSGTSLAIGGSGNTINFMASIPATGLAVGFHVLAIRARNADGVWGLFETRPFYISPSAANMGALVGGEYFIDSDPGVGNGKPFTFAASANSINEIVQMQIPAGTSTGDHLLVARVKDVNGVWSLFDTVRTLSVAGTLPLDFLSFSARRKDAKVLLDWTTENEINTSHFIVERSKNSIDFIPIGRVAASGGLQNTYAFEDAQPAKGLNFYRLKQVDRDSRSKYSSIVKVFFGDADMKDLKLFPQPVQSSLNVVFGGTGNNLFVQVYDAGGKMVHNERKQNVTTFTLETKALAKGAYWIVVSDGITQQKGQFIKQ